MSKPIKMTEQYMAECRADFEKALQLTKLADGKLSFTKVFTCGDRKATVVFTAGAWAKMALLVKEFDKEVAWHGVAHRATDEAVDEYIIEDIVVYPQEVSGTTVEMDTEKYAEWLMQNADDERFNNIHMQGHSHVNMPTSPSSVDLNHQEEILNMLGDDDFYIFMIWNKSFVSTNKIYDLKKNVLFEDKDITVKLEGEHEGWPSSSRPPRIWSSRKVIPMGTMADIADTAAIVRLIPAPLIILFWVAKRMRKKTRVARSPIRSLTIKNQTKKPKRLRSRAQESVQVGRGRMAVSSPCGMKTTMIQYIPMAATATSILEVSNNGNGFVQKLRVLPARKG